MPRGRIVLRRRRAPPRPTARQFAQLRRDGTRRRDFPGVVAAGERGESEVAGERDDVERRGRDDAGRTRRLWSVPGWRGVEIQQRRARGTCDGRRARVRRDLQLEPEQGAPAGLAFDPDAAAARLDPPARDGEAKAVTTETGGDIRAALDEGLENTVLRRLVDSDAGVANLDPQQEAAASIPGRNMDRDRATISEFPPHCRRGSGSCRAAARIRRG